MQQSHPSDPDYAGRKGANPPSYEAITNDRLTYVEYTDGEREYYDNQRDPQQLDNRWDELSTTRRAELKSALHNLQTCTGTNDCVHTQPTLDLLSLTGQELRPADNADGPGGRSGITTPPSGAI